MKINVIKVEFNGSEKVKTRSVYQHDRGQFIHITDDIPDGTEVQFGQGYNKTLNRYMSDGMVEIPDKLLKNRKEIHAYVKVIDSDSETTIKEIVIPVEYRQCPGDYIEPESEQSFREYVETKASKAGWKPNKILGTDGDGNIVEAEVADKANEAVYAQNANKAALADDSNKLGGKSIGHFATADAYNSLVNLLEEFRVRLNAVANSDDVTLDQLSEIVEYIKNNRGLIDSVTTSKVSVTDIVDNLITSVSDRPLSAKQGKALKDLIDQIIEEGLDAEFYMRVDEDGVIQYSSDGYEWHDLIARYEIRGESAYESAQRGGYTGTEAEFYKKLAEDGISEQINEHNESAVTHNDIRLLIEGLTNRLNGLADSDDTTLDQMSELVAYIKSNKSLIDSITTNKISCTDIIDNLTTNVSNKPLSAAQGVALKKLIDAITVPTKLSELTDDATHRTVTDAEKQAWNNKMDTETLQTATDEALRQAKESGEFNGKPGEPGHTPVKGTDYFTEEDKTELVDAVLAALPAAEEVAF